MSTIIKQSLAIATLKSFEGKQTKAIEAAISVAYYYITSGQVNMLNHLHNFTQIVGMKQATGKLLEGIKCHGFDKNAGEYSGKMTDKGKTKRAELLALLENKTPEDCFLALWAIAYPAKVDKPATTIDSAKLMKAQLTSVKKLHDDSDKWNALPPAVRLAYEALQRELERFTAA